MPNPRLLKNPRSWIFRCCDSFRLPLTTVLRRPDVRDRRDVLSGILVRAAKMTPTKCGTGFGESGSQPTWAEDLNTRFYGCLGLSFIVSHQA